VYIIQVLATPLVEGRRRLKNFTRKSESA